MTKYVNDEKQGLFADPEDRQFLRACRISFPVSSTTVHSWMVRQGGRWEPTRKDYYTDRVRVTMHPRVGCIRMTMRRRVGCLSLTECMHLTRPAGWLLPSLAHQCFCVARGTG